MDSRSSFLMRFTDRKQVRKGSINSFRLGAFTFFSVWITALIRSPCITFSFAAAE